MPLVESHPLTTKLGITCPPTPKTVANRLPRTVLEAVLSLVKSPTYQERPTSSYSLSHLSPPPLISSVIPFSLTHTHLSATRLLVLPPPRSSLCCCCGRPSPCPRRPLVKKVFDYTKSKPRALSVSLYRDAFWSHPIACIVVASIRAGLPDLSPWIRIETRPLRPLTVR